MKIGQVRVTEGRDGPFYEIKTTFAHLPELVAVRERQRLPDMFRRFVVIHPDGGNALGELWDSGPENDGTRTIDVCFTTAPGVKGTTARGYEIEPDLYDLFLLPRSVGKYPRFEA